MYELTTDGSILLVTTSQHNYTVYSLLSHSTYSFVIKPYNKAGEGPPATIEVTTNGGKLEVAGMAAVTLCWTKKGWVAI